MTKKQKIWLWIFAAMFIVPEVLWSPVGNFLYSIFLGSSRHRFLRANFLVTSSDRGLLLTTLLMQLIGLVGSTILISKKKQKNLFELFFLILLIVILIANFFILYLVWATNHIGS